MQAHEPNSYATASRATTRINSQAREEYVRTLVLESSSSQKRKANQRAPKLQHKSQNTDISQRHWRQQGFQSLTIRETDQLVALGGDVTRGAAWLVV